MVFFVKKVGPGSSAEKIQCLCNHLSSFGGNFFVAPNPIDFDYVFRKFPDIFESGNVLVLAMVLSIYGLWIIGIVIARRADRKDEYKVRKNDCNHLFHYRLIQPYLPMTFLSDLEKNFHQLLGYM